MRTSLLMLIGGFLILPLVAEAQPFSFQFLRAELDAFQFGSVAWGDLDRDGQLDLLLTGVPEVAGPPFTPTARAFLNRGERQVTVGENQVAPLRLFDALNLPLAVWHSATAFHDVDGDGDLDVFLTGAANADEPFTGTAHLLRNDGGSFARIDPGMPGLYSGSAAWGDYDNDGTDDLLLSGVDDGRIVTRLYRHDGNGPFTQADAGLTNVAFGEAAFGDYDTDGDLDVLLAGVTDSGFVAQVLRNDGGAFTDIEAGLPGLAFSNVAWGDYDNDGDLDFALGGGVLDARVFQGELYVFRNDGGDRFALALAGIGGFLEGDLAWGDYDNDGDRDLLAVGARFPDGPRTARLYQNQDGTLRHVTSFAGTIFGSAAWGDVDGDDDLDLVLTGLARQSNVLSNLYENAQKQVNTPPDPPAGLSADIAGGTVTLRWNPATDDQTPAPGLTYNLRVGTTPGGNEVVSSLADPATGRRYVAAPGNVFHNTAWRLAGLAPGTYTWSVQAVDAALTGSAFADEGTFTLSGTNETSTAVADAETPARAMLHASYPNPFREQTTLRYALLAPAKVRLAVYDVLGRSVKVLVDGLQAPGEQQVTWDGTATHGGSVAPGVYVYRLETGDGYAESRTLTVVR